MKIIKRKSDNVVLFARDDLSFGNGSLITPEFTAPTVLESEHDLLTVDSVPADWKGGWYTYSDSTWTLTSLGQVAIDNKNKTAQQQVNKQAVTANKQAVTDDALYTKLKSMSDTDAFIENCDEAARLRILKLLVKKIIT